MNATTALALVTSTFGGFGTALLALVGLFIAVAVGMLVFKIGWKHVKKAGK